MKQHKCEMCDQPATNHSVEIAKGQKIEKHLCDLHAAEQGLVAKNPHTPINELLTKFVQAHSGQEAHAEANCENCGLTFSQFREQSLLGCPVCYTSFESLLGPLMERAHEGATHHVGKVPRRAGSDQERQQQLLHMRNRLTEAIAAEDFELAARLRDDIRRYEEQSS